MKRDLDPQRLKADPALARVDAILAACTNCGCCNAACPTHELTGDEREAPRGRINLIRDMVERGGPPDPGAVQHIDTCLSCLSCTVVCPSGVDYMHLVDHARALIETRRERPLGERALRRLLTTVLPFTSRFRLAIRLGRLTRPMRGLLDSRAALRPLARMLDQLPSALPAIKPVAPGRYEAVAPRRHRVLMPTGCVQPVLDPAIDHSAIRLLNAVGVEVEVPRGSDCCGAIHHHLGRSAGMLGLVRRNVDQWWPLVQEGDVNAIISTASGCGSMLKDYGELLQDDPEYADRAARIGSMVVDVSAFLAGLDLPPPRVRPGLRVAYQAACSLQHGQRLLNEPKDLLRRAGYKVLSPQDEHLCCGAAGTYSLLHPETSIELRGRKVGALERLRPDVFAGGNMSCLKHLAGASAMPMVHTVQLLEWAWTGVAPEALAGIAASS